MPVYDYHCMVCGNTFSQLRPMAEYQRQRLLELRSSGSAFNFGATVEPDEGERALRASDQRTQPSRTGLSKHVCGAQCTHGKEKPALAGGRVNQRPWMLGY